MDGTLANGFRIHAKERIASDLRHAPVLIGRQFVFPFPSVPVARTARMPYAERRNLRESWECSHCNACSHRRNSCECSRCSGCSCRRAVSCTCTRCSDCGYRTTICTCTRCTRCSCRASNCTCTRCSDCGNRTSECNCEEERTYSDTVLLDDGREFEVCYLASGAETTCYAIADDDAHVLLVVREGSADKDVLCDLTTAGYAHVLQTEYIGTRRADGRKVYRQVRIPSYCIGSDDADYAHLIRKHLPYRFDATGILAMRHVLPASIVLTLCAMIRRYRAYGSDVHLDLHSRNYATLDDGTFILLDPFYRG